MYPPKKSDEETAVQGALESLMRAGLEVTGLMKDQSTGAWVVRLYSMPPKNGVSPLLSYIRHYIKACGFKASAKLTKCRLWVTIEPAATAVAAPRQP